MAKAWVYGDNVDTDVIIPARYLTTTDAATLAEHVLEDLDPSFAEGVSEGDVVVAGSNFGCGSSREHAPVALKAAGVSGVVARSFARIFFRNAINTGLQILVCPEAEKKTTTGDEVFLDASAGIVRNHTGDWELAAEPLPGFMTEIVDSGGLVEWVRNKRHG